MQVYLSAPLWTHPGNLLTNSLLDILPIPTYICRMSRKKHSVAALLSATLILATVPATSFANSDTSEREAAVSIVLRIQKADYEGDRSLLQRLHDQLLPFVASKNLGSRVLYWQGFALWRKAMNGFNDNVDKKRVGTGSHSGCSGIRAVGLLRSCLRRREDWPRIMLRRPRLCPKRKGCRRTAGSGRKIQASLEGRSSSGAG